jgi:Fic family protein
VFFIIKWNSYILLDGNGRMGRLWQTFILMSEYQFFEFLPFETLVSQTQDDYYKSLSLSDKSGKSTYIYRIHA